MPYTGKEYCSRKLLQRKKFELLDIPLENFQISGKNEEPFSSIEIKNFKIFKFTKWETELILDNLHYVKNLKYLECSYDLLLLYKLDEFTNSQVFFTSLKKMYWDYR